MASFRIDTITGAVSVLAAEDVERVSAELVDNLADWVTRDDGETIQLDTAGEYRYRRVGFEDPDDCRVIIYERIKP